MVFRSALPLPYGKYTLAMAVTSPNLQKVGIVYYDLNVPGPESYQSSIDASSLVVINDMQQMEKPELTILTHKASFTYAVFRINPNIDYGLRPRQHDRDVLLCLRRQERDRCQRHGHQ